MGNKLPPLLFLIFFLTACRPAPIVQATRTSSDVLPIPTITVEPGDPATTIPPTRPATLTPFPTVSEEDKLNYVDHLFQTNANCQLPCWWGFTPGISTWEKLKDFISSLANQIITTTPGGDEEFIYARADFPLNVALDQTDERLVYVQTDQQTRIVKQIDFLADYSLASVLSQLGKPDRVLFFTHGAEPNGLNNTVDEASYSLAMDFPDDGILISLNGTGTFSVSEAGMLQIDVCLDSLNSAFKWFILWDPTDSRWTTKTTTSRIKPEYLRDLEFHPLSDVTSTNISEFMSNVISDRQEYCFHTDAMIWESQITVFMTATP